MNCAEESLTGNQCGLTHVTPLFRSFLQAGFECSTHKLRTGKRLDLVSSSRHDTFVGADYKRLSQVGIATVREGIRWHLIEAQPGVYDFLSARRILEAAHLNGIEIVWDLLHFGWPNHLDIFDPSWVHAFGEFAFRFGKLLEREGHGTIYIAPVNEISFMSWAGGDTAYLNPFATNRGPELKRQLVRAYLRAAQGLRAELPEVRLVSPEPVIHMVGRPERPDDVREAAEYTSSMFEAWDLITTGRSQPELGGAEGFVAETGTEDAEQPLCAGRSTRFSMMNLSVTVARIRLSERQGSPGGEPVSLNLPR